MTKEEVLHLGGLARLKMGAAEAEAFRAEISAILEYVGAVNDLVEAGDLEKVPGPIFNVFRADEATNEPEQYRAGVVEAFPRRRGDYLEVKQILNPDS